VVVITEEGLARKAPAFIFESVKYYKDTHGRRIAIKLSCKLEEDGFSVGDANR